MTKYILHGGNIRGSQDGGKAYFEEVVRDLGEQPRLLLCFFAQLREDWENRYAELTTRLSSMLSCRPVFVMAMPDEYNSQAAQSDALLISGGDDELLLHWAEKTDGFQVSLKSFKVVAGSSAGAMLLVKKYWTCDWRMVRSGLGVLQQNLIVHYDSPTFGKDDPRGPIDWAKAEQELRAAAPDRPIIKLAEGEFETFNL